MRVGQGEDWKGGLGSRTAQHSVEGLGGEETASEEKETASEEKESARVGK